MTTSAIAARIVNALEAAATQEAGAPTSLVSLSIDIAAAPDTGAIRVGMTRKTRTLVFMGAEFVADSGQRIATAASVHKIAGGE